MFPSIFDRILRLHEMGLISLWQNWFEPNTRPCLNDKTDNGNAKKKKKLARISISNLTGAFAFLAIGCIISFLIFLIERIVFRWKMNLPRN